MMRVAAPVSIVLAIALLAGCASQKKVLTTDQVPAPVAQTFHQMYPDVQSPAWALKTDQNYEAEFTAAGAEVTVKFSPAGKWLETETAIAPAAVPAAVNAAVSTNFKGYSVVETQSIKRPGTSALDYELHLDNGKEIVKAQFAADGTILTQQSKPKE